SGALPEDQGSSGIPPGDFPGRWRRRLSPGRATVQGVIGWPRPYRSSPSPGRNSGTDRAATLPDVTTARGPPPTWREPGPSASATCTRPSATAPSTANSGHGEGGAASVVGAVEDSD